MLIKQIIIYIFAITLLAITLLTSSLYSKHINWEKLEKGLHWKTIISKIDNETVNINILKINPNFFSFHLFMASQRKHPPLSLKKWAKKYKLLIAVNASMYLPDGLKSTGYMKNYQYFNNSTINKKFGSFIVFNPKKYRKKKHFKKKRDISIIDKSIYNWEKKLNNYHTIIQNYRIIVSNNKIVWKKGKKKSSIITFCTDKNDNILIVFCKDKVSTFSFAKKTLTLSLKIRNMTYLEGGHEASLCILHENLKINTYGKLFSNKSIRLHFENKLPNIIGIRKKQ
jgi:hypothetical protein